MSRKESIAFVLHNSDAALEAAEPVAVELAARGHQVHALWLTPLGIRDSASQAAIGIFDSIEEIPVSRFGTSRPVRLLNFHVCVSQIRRWLSRCRPRVTVLGVDNTSPYYNVVVESRHLGIKSILMQESIRKDHGFQKPVREIVTKYLRRPWRYEYGKLRHGEGGCDRIAAWGAEGRHYFIDSAGVSPDQVVITGSPRVQSFESRLSAIDPIEAKTKTGLPSSLCSACLFATNPIDSMGMVSKEQYRNSLMQAIDVAAQAHQDDDKIWFLVKPHRLELERFIDWGLPSLCDRDGIIYLGDTSLEIALAASERVVVFNSTVALEAQLVGRAAAVFNPFGVDLCEPFTGRGLASHLFSDQDLKAWLETTNTCTASADMDYFVDRSGNAGARIADLVSEFLRGSSSGA